jgi:hypothetical protein
VLLTPVGLAVLLGVLGGEFSSLSHPTSAALTIPIAPVPAARSAALRLK